MVAAAAGGVPGPDVLRAEEPERARRRRIRSAAHRAADWCRSLGAGAAPDRGSPPRPRACPGWGGGCVVLSVTTGYDVKYVTDAAISNTRVAPGLSSHRAR